MAKSIDEALGIMDELETKDPTLSHVLLPRGKKRVKFYKPDNHPAVAEFINAIERFKKTKKMEKEPKTAEAEILDTRKQATSTLARENTPPSRVSPPEPKKSEGEKNLITQLAELDKTKTKEQANVIMRAPVEAGILRKNGDGFYQKTGKNPELGAAFISAFRKAMTRIWEAEKNGNALKTSEVNIFDACEQAKKTIGAKTAVNPQTPALEPHVSGKAKEAGASLIDLQKATTIDEAVKIMEVLEAKDPSLSHVLVARGEKMVKSHSPENHPAVIEYRNAIVRIKKAERAKRETKAPKADVIDIHKQTKGAIEGPIGATPSKPAPLSITLLDGSTYADPRAFKEFFKELKQSDEKKAESVRAEYAKRMIEHIEQIKNEASLLTQKVSIASRIVLKPKHKDGHPGVRDMAKLFVKKGYLTLNDNEEFVPTVAGTEELALAANKRIRDLVLANKIRHRMIDGFMEVAKDTTFVYQIGVGVDEATGFPKVTVSNVISLHGKPTVAEKDYILGIDSPPSFIQAAMRELKRRKREYDEKGLNYRDWRTLRHGKDSDEPNSIEDDAINPYPKKK